ncbi:MAG: tetratricopeptide repeat protein, partial [bacterium]|nr:tetratricopeptide repeat protein [bacterium]
LGTLDTEPATQLLRGYLEKYLQYPPERWGAFRESVLVVNMDNGKNAENILKLCIEKPELDVLLPDILVTLGEVCDEVYRVEDLFEEMGEGEFVDTPLSDNLLQFLENLREIMGEETATELETLLDKKAYVAVVQKLADLTGELLASKKEAFGSEAYELWADESDTLKIRTQVIAALASVIESFAVTQQLQITGAAFFLFVGLTKSKALLGKPLKDITVDEAMKTLFDEEPVTKDLRLLKLLENPEESDREALIEDCFNRLDAVPPYTLGRLIKVILGLGDTALHERLMTLETLESKFWGTIADDYIKHKSADLNFFEPFLLKSNTDLWTMEMAMLLLSQVPTARVVQVFLDNWDNLMQFKTHFLEGVIRLGDRRFVAPLKKEIKDGDVEEIEAFIFLCRINGIKDPALKKLEKFVRGFDKATDYREKLLEEGRYLEYLKLPVGVKLKCRKCDRTYLYWIKPVGLLEGTDNIIIRQPIICKNCKAFDSYYILGSPAEQLYVLWDKLFAANVSNEDRNDISYHFFTPHLLEGNPATLAQMETHYFEMMEKEPDNIDAQMNYADILHESGRGEEAEVLFEEIITRAPLAVEAYMTLAGACHARGLYKESYDYYLKVLEIRDSGNFYLGENDEEFLTSLYRNISTLAMDLNKVPPDEVRDWLEKNYS